MALVTGLGLAMIMTEMVEAQERRQSRGRVEGGLDARMLADLEILRDLELLRELETLRRMEEIRNEPPVRGTRTEEKGKP
jgi:hypothetical protein